MKSKRLLAVILSVAVMLSIVIIPVTNEVSADSYPAIKYKENIEISSLDADGMFMLDLRKIAKENDKLYIKSSDTSVIWIQSDYPYFSVKKTGTAKIIIKNKTRNKKYKCTITVVNDNPFRSLKVGKKGFRKEFRLGTEGSFEPSAAKCRISITPRKGWKLKKIKYCTYKRGSLKLERDTLKKKTVKNKAKITFKSDEDKWGEYFLITMYDTKTKKNHEFRLQRGAF